MDVNNSLIEWFEDLDNDDVEQVGGKNASLGEMLGAFQQYGIRVPGGFATTTEAYWLFVEQNDLKPVIKERLDQYHQGKRSLQETGRDLRTLFEQAEVPAALSDAITSSYRTLS